MTQFQGFPGEPVEAACAIVICWTQAIVAFRRNGGPGFGSFFQATFLSKTGRLEVDVGGEWRGTSYTPAIVQYANNQVSHVGLRQRVFGVETFIWVGEDRGLDGVPNAADCYSGCRLCHVIGCAGVWVKVSK